MMLGRVPVEPDALAARAESEGAVTQMRKDGGFTLVELMVVVAILAVLTMVAITSYKYYIRRARSEEGKAMLMEIKMKQEHFFSTYSYYMSSAANENSLYPAATQNPKTSSGSSDKTMYDWSKMNCAAPAAGEVGWCNLGFRPQGPTYFRAVTIGWNKTLGNTPPASTYGIVQGMNFNRRWFYAAVHGDMDLDGTLSTFIITSQSNAIITDREIE